MEDPTPRPAQHATISKASAQAPARPVVTHQNPTPIPPQGTEVPDDEPDPVAVGVVTKFFGQNDKWCAGVLRGDDGQTIKFAGEFTVELNTRVRVSGPWTYHQKFGWQITLKTVEPDVPTDPAGFIGLLSNDKRFFGIGPVRAQAIVDILVREKLDLVQVLEDQDERLNLADKAKVPHDVMETLAKEWLAARNEHGLTSTLIGMGLSHRQVRRFAKAKGGLGQLILRVRKDPYYLVRAGKGIGFKKADKVARKLGIKGTHPARLAAALRESVKKNLDGGHTWVYLSDVMEDARDLLRIDVDEESGKRKNAKLAAELDALLEDPKNEEKVVGKRVRLNPNRSKVRVISLRGIAEQEHRLIKDLQSKPSEYAQFAVYQKPEDLLRFESRLNPDQVKAVWTAMHNTRTVITGPAGVGKTFVVTTLVDAFKQGRYEVAVMAPTGRAAKRLEETFAKKGLKFNATTIHRGLGYSQRGGWKHGSGKWFDSTLKDWVPSSPHPADLIIVDEVSMCSVPLLWRVLDALKFGASLVLVGDHNQIPSIEAGAVLRDLTSTGLCPVVELTEIVRQAGVLRANALKVLKGRLRPTEMEAGKTFTPWIVKDTFRDEDDVVEAVKSRFTKVLKERGQDGLFSCQIITAMNVRSLGVERLNRELQAVAQSVLYGETLDPDRPSVKLMEGDKVMQTQNDYEHDLMNGEQAFVIWADRGDVRIKVTNGTKEREVELPMAKAANLKLAYATTIHKFQGSQVDDVIGVCHSSQAFMFDRNLFYTMVTRAARSVRIIGDARGMQQALAKRTTDNRQTFMMLWNPKE